MVIWQRWLQSVLLLQMTFKWPSGPQYRGHRSSFTTFRSLWSDKSKSKCFKHAAKNRTEPIINGKSRHAAAEIRIQSLKDESALTASRHPGGTELTDARVRPLGACAAGPRGQPIRRRVRPLLRATARGAHPGGWRSASVTLTSILTLT